MRLRRSSCLYTLHPTLYTQHHPTLHNNKKNIWNTDQKQSVSSPQEAMHQV